MADREIVIRIRSVVDNIASKLKNLTGGLDTVLKANTILSESYNTLSKNQQASVKTLKNMTDGQKALGKGFLDLDSKVKTVATRYANLDDSHKKLGSSYYKLSESIRNGSQTATAAQTRLINQWKALPAHVKGALTSFQNQNAANQQLIRGFSGLEVGLRRAITHFASFPRQLQNINSGVLNFNRGMQTAGRGVQTLGKSVIQVDKLKNAFSQIGRSIFNFNNGARTVAGVSRAVGTSMIFAGGSFRHLGVAINVASSAVQSFLPMLGSLGSAVVQGAAALGPYGLLLVPIAGALAAFAASAVVAALEVGALGAALYEVGTIGFEFNSVMETTQIAIATLTTQFKDIYLATGQQVGAYDNLTDAQLKNLNATQRDAYVKEQSLAIADKFVYSLNMAQAAFRTLTIEAAQSPYTTQQLASGFQAVEAVMGQYNISLEDTAKLTVSLARTASVAGVSAGNLASQFTLFLSGAGRITSPLSRFASQIGLTKDKMKELRDEFAKAKGDPEKTAAIMSVLTTRLAAFDYAGQKVASSWKGIMSNMGEAVELFAGSVTGNLFNTLRDAFYKLEDVVDASGKRQIILYDENRQKIKTIVEGSAKQEGDTYDALGNLRTRKVKDANGKIITATAEMQTKVTGLLSKIFDYDESGKLKTSVADIGDVFSKSLQPVIKLFKVLFDIIGSDIVSAMKSIGDGIGGFAETLGENKNTIVEIYLMLKSIVYTVIDIVFTFFRMLGAADTVEGSINRTWGVLKTVQVLLIGISAIFKVIAGIVDIIAGLVLAILSPVALIVTGIIDLVNWLAGVETKTSATAGWFGLITGSILNGLGLMRDTTTEADRLLSLEEQRLKVIRDQNVDLQTQLIRAQLINQEYELDKNNPNSALSKKIKADKEQGINVDTPEYAAKAQEEIKQRYSDARKSPRFKTEYDKMIAADQSLAEWRAKRRNEMIDEATKDLFSPYGTEAKRKEALDKEFEKYISTPDANGVTIKSVKEAAAEKLIADQNKKVETKPTEGKDKEGGAKTPAVRIQKRVLDTLFKEEKEYSEARIALELALLNQQQELARKRADLFLTSLETQLREGEIAFTDYYAKVNKMAEVSNQNEINRVNSEITALEARHQLELESLKQEEYKNKAELSIADNASKRVDAERDLAAIKIRRQTLEVTYQTELNKLQKESGELQKQALEYDAVKYANLIKLRDATRDYFSSVRELQTKLNDALDDPFDTKAIEFSLAQITRSYADAYKKFIAVRDSKDASPAEKQAAIESIERIERLEELERARYTTKKLIERLDIQTTSLEREQERLDEKRKYGLITEAQYIKANNELRLKFLAEYKTRVDELDTARVEALDRGDRVEAVRLEGELQDARFKYNKLLNVTEDKLLDINKTLREGLGDFFTTILEDVNNLGDAFINLGKLVQRTFQKALVDRLMKSSFFDKLFGNPNQTEGRAVGLVAENGRRQALDENTQFGGKKPNQEAFLGSTVSLGKDEELDAAKTRLTEAISANASETGTLNTQIDILAKKFAEFGVVVDEVSGKIKAVPLAKATPNSVESSKTGSTESGSLSELIGRKESFGGQYGAWNKVVKGADGKNKVVGSGVNRNFENMTIGQIMSMQASKQIYAAGKFQFIPDTLKTAVGYAGLGQKDKFSGENQEKLFRAFLAKSPTLQAANDFITGKTSGKKAEDAAINALASQWAALKQTNGKGRWDGSINKASIRADEVRNVLLSERAAILGGGSSDATIDGNPFQTTVDTQGTTPSKPLYVTPVSSNGNTDTLETKQTTQTPEDNGLIAQINDKVGLIATAVGESGLGMIKTSVASIETKFTEFSTSWSTFVTTGLSTTLEPFVARIITAISAKQLIDTTASNISVSSGNEGDGFAYGGYISGPGGPTEDKVPAWLSNGEFVVKAAAVKALGIDNLHKINNADKEFPKFGFGGFVSGIFKNIGKFLKTDAGKLVLGTVIPMVAQKFLGEKAASAISLALPFLFNLKGKGGSKKPDATKQITDLTLNPTSGKAAFESQFFKQTPRLKAAGGLIGRFAKGGLAKSPFGTFAGKPKFIGGIPAAEGGFWSSANGEAVKGGAISAAFSIGMALLGRWQANKAWKKQLEEYKKNRTKDPYGMNPDTLTFYKKPIITGSRNWLAKGGLISPDMMLRSMPTFAAGGLSDINLEDIIKDAQIGDNPMNITQNINITTPDVHSFRNSRGQLERDLARVTQRGLKRRAPKY